MPINATTLKHIQQCYSAVGKPLDGLPNGFSSYDFETWRHPIMTPIFYSKYRFNLKDFDRLQRYFQEYGPRSNVETTQAFVSVFASSERNIPAPIKELKKYGWKPEVINYINYFDQTLPYTILNGYRTIIGNYFDPKILKKFRSLSGLSFDSPKKRLDHIDIGSRSARSPMTVLIETLEGKIVAAGAVFTNKPYAYLFSGSIHPEYRNQGLWKALVGLRQSLSYALGARHWVYSTSNSYILIPGPCNWTMILCVTLLKSTAL
ncbi:MAG: hypothetical protein R3A45_08820 [Bdellovibrionota bacterium]